MVSVVSGLKSHVVCGGKIDYAEIASTSEKLFNSKKSIFFLQGDFCYLFFGVQSSLLGISVDYLSQKLCTLGNCYANVWCCKKIGFLMRTMKSIIIKFHAYYGCLSPSESQC